MTPFEAKRCIIRGWLLAIVGCLSLPVQAVIDGVTGSHFELVAKEGHITASDGNRLYTWGYAERGGLMQYPGPTLIVDQGEVVTVTLRNELTVPVSIVFPGQKVTAQGGKPGVLTRESTGPDDVVVYRFIAEHPGTYMYHSGTRPDVQVEMGLAGALIVRPNDQPGNERWAYNQTLVPTRYDQEYLFFLSSMDIEFHDLVEAKVLAGQMDEAAMNALDTTDYSPEYWMINGRTAPDTMLSAFIASLPNQPYNCLPRIHPGETLLMRVVEVARQGTPYHTHGNNFLAIARDGRLFESAPGQGPDLAFSDFTLRAFPGETYDALFRWTGQELGWDFFGHALSDAIQPSEVYAQAALLEAVDADENEWRFPHEGFPTTHRFRVLITDGADTEVVVLTPKRMVEPNGDEDTFIAQRGQEGTAPKAWGAGAQVMLTDHGKAFPVILPDALDLAFGPFYSGSPFLGALGQLPPGEGGLNVNGGLTYMWHSHNEKELTTGGIFPGGMLTMLIVEAPGVPIP